MKIRWFPFLRLMLLGLITNLILQDAGVSFGIQVGVAFMLGLTYPENAIVDKDSPDVE